jgi:hypothetical protein
MGPDNRLERLPRLYGSRVLPVELIRLGAADRPRSGTLRVAPLNAANYITAAVVREAWIEHAFFGSKPILLPLEDSRSNLVPAQ